MSEIFENVKKNFGFGCMRFPMANGEVDLEETQKMIDTFLENGFNYFDTAHGYLDGKSEVVLKECLTSRYPRTSYILTNKLSSQHFQKNEDIRPLFAKQLEICGVDYFDFYLMHAQDQSIFQKYKKCRAYETAMELRKEGLIKHLGISFHDKAAVLEEILQEYPEIEVVQIQLNYIDFEDSSVESRKCLEVCRKYGKPVIVMEPVKGGSLVNLPEEAREIFRKLNGGSNASYAIRFAASQKGVFMVLSGMGSMDMVMDNVGYMKNFQPLTQEENAAIAKVCEIFRNMGMIPCTGCRYCTEVCPQKIAIPALFSCLNAKKLFQNWNSDYYSSIHTQNAGKASDCIKCGKCEKICPQHLKIREYLELVSEEFEKESQQETD